MDLAGKIEKCTYSAEFSFCFALLHFSCTSMSPLVLLCPLSSFKLDKVPFCLSCLPLAPGVLQVSVFRIGQGRVQTVTVVPLLGQVW